MAKGIIASLLVNVTSKGASKTKADIKSIADASRDVGEAQAIAAARGKNFFNTQEKGVIGTANSTKSFSKLAQTINGGGSSSVVAAYATLMANVFSLTAAFGALKGAAQVQQVEAGLVALGARMGQTLTTASKDLKALTDNTLSTEQAMRSAAQVFSAGFDSKELSKIGAVARDASFALGREMTDSMDRLTRGIIKMEPELLDELGIMTRMGDATKTYAYAMGKAESALTTAERRQAFFNAVIAEGEAKYKGLADAAGDTRNWDKLSATFRDLIKELLNGINKIALPLAGIFANNPATILGGMVLFASTIKSQMLPGLASLQQRTQSVAEAFAEVAESQAEAQTKHTEKLKEMQEDQFNKNLSLPTIPRMGAGNSAYNRILKELDAGHDDVLDDSKLIQTALGRVNQELERAQKEQKELVVGSAGYRKNMKLIEQDIKDLTLAQDILTNGVREEFNMRQQIAGMEKQARVLDARSQLTNATASAHQKMGGALEAASVGQYRAGMDMLKQSVLQYSNATKLATVNTGLMTKSMGLLRVAAFATSGALKMMGIAFMNALNIIGWVVMAIGAIVGAIKALESEGSKKYKAAIENMAAANETFINTQKELVRLEGTQMTNADRELKYLSMRASATRDLAVAMEEVLATRSRRGFFSLEPSEPGADEIGMSDKKAKKMFGNTGWFGMTAGSDTKVFREMYKQIEATQPEVIELAGGFERLEKMSTDAKLKAMTGAIKEFSSNTQHTVDGINAVREGLERAGKAMDAYVKKLVGSTDVDEIVAGLSDALTAGTNIGAKDHFLGMSSDELRLISAETARIVGLQQTIERTKNATTATDKVAHDFATRLLGTQKVTNEQVRDELAATHQLFAVEQRRLILSQSQGNLLSAHLNKYKASYALTAAGVGKQIDGENKLAQMKVDELRMAFKQLEIEISAQKLKIEDIKNSKTIYENMLASYDVQLDQLATARKQLETATKIRILSETGNEQLTYKQQLTDLIAENEKEAALIAEKKEVTEQAINNLKSNAATAAATLLVLEAKIGAAANNIAAAQLGITSEMDKQVAISSKALENYSKQHDQYVSGQKLALETLQNRRKLAQIENGTVETVDATVEFLKAGHEIAEEELKIKHAIATLENELQISAAKADANRADEYQMLLEKRDLMATFQSLELDRLRTSNQVEIAEKKIFNSYKEGVEVQQQALDIAKQLMEARRGESAAYADIGKAERELARRRLGFVANEDDDKAEEIRAAAQALTIAKEEVSMKKGMIELEFTLLDAKMQVLEAELRGRRTSLEGNPEAQSQVDATLASLDRSRGALDASREAALRVPDLLVEQLSKELQVAMAPEGRYENAASSYQNLKNAQREGSQALAKIVEDNHKVVAGSVHIMEEVAGSQTELVHGMTNKLIPTLERNSMVGDPAKVEGMSAARIMELVGDAWKANLAANGMGEAGYVGHSEHGRVGTHTNGSLHYSDRAVDLNIGDNNKEWDNATQRAFVQGFLNELKALGGFDTIFNGTNHNDHGHAELDRIGELDRNKLADFLAKYLPEFKARIEEAAPAIAEATAETTATRLADIEVTATRRPASAQNPFAASAEGVVQLGDPAYWDEVINHVERLNSHANILYENFGKMGPEGELMQSVMNGFQTFASSYRTVMDTMSDSTANVFEKISSIGQAVSSSIGAIQQIYQASTNAKIANIDAEIAAEQKRDGKSSESLAKIEAMERKKEATQRKAFEVNKKLQLAQAVIGTATGVAQALSYGPPGIPLAVLIGALGAAQIALIAGQTYQGGGGQTKDIGAQSLTIGKRGDSVDLARNNANAGGEIGYLRGAQGYGRSASDYVAVGSAYGGALGRGYGNAAYLVGEQGPEFIVPDAPATVVPSNQANQGNPVNATFNINTLDASGVQDVLHSQRGFIIGSIREAANANGESFLENVSTDVYTKPNVGKL